MLNFKNRPRCRQLPVTPRSQPRWVIHTFLDLSFRLTAHLRLWTPRSQSTPTRVVTRIPRIQCGKNNSDIHLAIFKFIFLLWRFHSDWPAMRWGHLGRKRGKCCFLADGHDSQSVDIRWLLFQFNYSLSVLLHPLQLGPTESSGGGITDWIHSLLLILIWLTGSDKTFQSSSSLTETLEPNNWGASLQEGSGGRVRWLWDKAES